MPDERPIPRMDSGGIIPSYKKDLANPESTHPIRERVANWINEYIPNFIERIMSGSARASSPLSGNGNINTSKMLYEAIHPDTFGKVLDILRPTPISRQAGGPLEEGREYVAGEGGRPERIKMFPGGGGQAEPLGRSYMGEAGTTGPEGKFTPAIPGIGGRAYQTFIDPWVQEGKGLYGGYQKYIGQPFAETIGGLTKPISEEAQYIATGRRTPKAPIEIQKGPTATPEVSRYPTEREHGGYGMPIETTPSITPSPTSTSEGRYRIGEGEWQNMPSDYWERPLAPGARAGFSVIPKGEGAPIAPETPAGPRTYYEAHPEERYMAMAEQANKPYMDAYLRSIEDARAQMQGFNLPMDPRLAAGMRAGAAGRYAGLTRGLPGTMAEGAKIPFQYYKAGMEYGPGSPLSRLRSAQAGYYEQLPAEKKAETEMHWNTYLMGIRERQAERRAETQVRGETADAQREERLYQTILSTHTSVDPMNPLEGKVTNWNEVNKALRDAVRAKTLPPEYIEGLPPVKATKPTTPPSGNKEGRYDIGGGEVWNWTKAKGWYQ